MTLEQQVVSYELADALKEAGFPQDDTAYGYARTPGTMRAFGGDFRLFHTEGRDGTVVLEWIAAPTAAELGQYLSAEVCGRDFCLTPAGPSRWCCVEWPGSRQREKGFHAATMADAAALALLDRIDAGLFAFPAPLTTPGGQI